MKENLSISSIETFLYSKLKNVVSKNTFAGTFPSAIDKKWNDMCLIDCGSSISDMNAYGEGVVLVWLYAKPRTDGSKNVATLSSLESKLNEVLPSLFDDKYFVSRRNTYSDYDAKIKWHCVIVELNLIVK